MINTIVRKPTKTILYGAALTAVALVIALLAVSFATGSAQADGSTGGTSGGTSDPTYPNLSTYDDPQPCGPGADGILFMDEPHEIRTGHYALFDAYWRTIKEGASIQGMDVPGVGVLHTNLCPPELVEEKKRGGGYLIKRSARTGGMDVDEAIMHVLDKHLATTVDSNPAAGELSLEEYPRVAEAVSVGDRVWWLQLNDPDTAADETSDLGIGFSTALLDDERWNSPIRYRLLMARYPINPGDLPHFFAYEAPKANGAAAELVWDSALAGQGVMELAPGVDYKALQWVFTKPGTYLLWVHLEGKVKKHAGEERKDISGNVTETSEVYRYTIEVGSDLDETEPPIFGVNRSVGENTPGGINVGDPIPVYNAEADTLYYDLTGPGHSNFKTVVASTDPHAVQIVVADGANLDYETKKYYELNLTVTDRVDHEHNFDPSVDDVLIVRINVEDQAPSVLLRSDRGSVLDVGETTNLYVRYEPTPANVGREPDFDWATNRQSLHDGVQWPHIHTPEGTRFWPVTEPTAMEVEYRVVVTLEAIQGETKDPRLPSNPIEIFWGDAE